MSIAQRSRLVATLTLAGTLATFVGCKAKEPAPARVPYNGPAMQNSDTGMTTPVPIEYLDDMVTEASQWLVQALPDKVKSAKTRQYFAVPATLETDLGVPDGRMRQALSRLEAELSQAANFTDSFIVISSTEATANREIGIAAGKDTSRFRDAFQREEDTTVAEVKDPSKIYTMSGKFYQDNDRATGRRSFHLFIRVNAPVSRTSVLNRDFAYNLKWNGRTGRWERDA